jgi:hypothetical protein
VLRPRLTFIALTILAIVTIVAAITAAMPRKYAATARVLLPASASAEVSELAPLAAARNISVSATGASRMLVVQHVSRDPRVAATVVNDFVTSHARKNMVLIDEASVPQQPVGPDFTLNVGLAGAAGLVLGLAVVGLRERRARPPKPRQAAGEGAPPSAVLSRDKSAYEQLCRELLASWFCSHRMLAIVGPGDRAPRANVAARLAVGFAELGEKTLLVDAGAKPAEAIRVTPVKGVQNLYLLQAPRERLASVLTEAGRRFRVVLIDVPADQTGRHAFAALAGGALLVRAKDLPDPGPLRALQAELERAPVRIVATVVNTE